MMKVWPKNYKCCHGQLLCFRWRHQQPGVTFNFVRFAGNDVEGQQITTKDGSKGV